MTMGDYPYPMNSPEQKGEFNAGSARYQTGKLDSNFAYFTPEIIYRVTKLDVPPTQREFELLVGQIATEYNAAMRSEWLRTYGM